VHDDKALGKFENSEHKFEFHFVNSHASFQGTGFISDNDPDFFSSFSTRCQWTIKPNEFASDKNGYIDIYFQSLTLSGGWLEIFDSELEENSIVFWQTSVHHLPPPMRISGLAVHMVWYGLGQGRSSVSFELTYASTTMNDESNGSVTYGDRNQVVVPLLYPWAQIISPDVDRQIGKNCQYIYKIYSNTENNPNGGAFQGPITIMFTDIYLPDPNDKILIFDGLNSDGTPLSVITGTKAPDKWLKTTNNEALIVLVTDYINDDGYFQFTYIANGDKYECGYYEPEIKMTGNTQIFTDGTTSSSDLRALETCRWIIQPQNILDDDENTQINLIFNRVSIKRSAILKVYDGLLPFESNLLWNCMGCLNVVPPILTSKTGSFFIILISDETSGLGRTGFEAEYFVQHQKSIGTGDGNIKLSMASQLCVQLPSTGSLPIDFDFFWYLKPNNLRDDPIILVVTHLKLSDDCQNNVTIFDGPDVKSPILSILCGTFLPLDWMFSSGKSLTIRLQTRNKTDIDINETFEFMHYSNSDRYRCGYADGNSPGVYKASSMLLNDGKYHGDNFSSSMESNLNCEWIVRPNIDHSKFNINRD